jgi:Large extracellular alpha-helical protein
LQNAIKRPVLEGKFTSNKLQELTAWKDLPSGEYNLALSALDEKGRKATCDKLLVLFSVNDKQPPVSKPMWCKLMDTTFAPDKPATILFGSGEKNVHVIYDVFAGGKHIESRRLDLSNSVQRFDIPYKEEYGDGIYVNFCFVKNGQVYQQGESIQKALPDNKLTLKWDVFRDKLKPGQKEEWKLTIKNTKETAAEAEFLASMYDTSLDKIWKRDQGLSVNFGRVIPTVNWIHPYSNSNSYYFDFLSKEYNFQDLSYDELMKIYMNSYERDANLISFSARTKGSKVAISIADVKGNDEANGKDIAEMKQVAYGVAITKEKSEETLDKNVPVRENFNETAFFYPQLRTNEKGEVSFSFTMPESFTRWKFKGIAHTKDMQIGTIDGETVTSKDFMLTPNMPRFVRVGDRSSISTRIINVSQKDVAGEVKMQLFDPATEKVILTKKQAFSVKAGQTSSASFEFTADAAYSLLGCRLVGDGGTFQ